MVRARVIIALFLIILTLIFGGLELITFGKVDFYSTKIRPHLAGKDGKQPALQIFLILGIVIPIIILIVLMWGWLFFLLVWVVVWALYATIGSEKDDGKKKDE